jgi:hypothetical protein
MKKAHPNLPKVRKVDDPKWLPAFKFMNALPPNAEVYRAGTCYIIFMRPDGEFLHRMVIAKQSDYPVIDEIMNAWHQLVPDAVKSEAIIMLPKQYAYDNPHDFSFTIQEVPVQDVVRENIAI